MGAKCGKIDKEEERIRRQLFLQQSATSTTILDRYATISRTGTALSSASRPTSRISNKSPIPSSPQQIRRTQSTVLSPPEFLEGSLGSAKEYEFRASNSSFYPLGITEIKGEDREKGFSDILVETGKGDSLKEGKRKFSSGFFESSGELSSGGGSRSESTSGGVTSAPAGFAAELFGKGLKQGEGAKEERGSLDFPPGFWSLERDSTVPVTPPPRLRKRSEHGSSEFGAAGGGGRAFWAPFEPDPTVSVTPPPRLKRRSEHGSLEFGGGAGEAAFWAPFEPDPTVSVTPPPRLRKRSEHGSSEFGGAGGEIAFWASERDSASGAPVTPPPRLKRKRLGSNASSIASSSVVGGYKRLSSVGAFAEEEQGEEVKEPPKPVSRKKGKAMTVEKGEEQCVGGDVPVFVREMSDVAVKVGTRARLLVEVDPKLGGSGEEILKITWFRNEQKITIPADAPTSRIHQTSEGRFHYLDISPVITDDEGKWVCTAENFRGRSSCACQVKVMVPKSYRAPEFVEGLRAVLTEAGTVSLECKVIGTPTPLLKWYKDGVEIKAGDIFALRGDPSSLGVYTCEATNCMGSVTSSSRVHMNDPSSPHPPHIQVTHPLQDSRIRVGERLDLQLALSKHLDDSYQVTWYNKSNLIAKSDRVIQRTEGNICALYLNPVEIQDDGEWVCEIGWGKEKIVASCTLSILVPRNYRRPKFLEDLKAILTEEGLVSFECKVCGFPTPILHWYKDGYELKPGDVYQLSGANSLGRYSCIAHNCMGDAESSTELTLEDIQHQLSDDERKQLMAEGLGSKRPPKFLTGLKSLEAKIGDPCELSVEVNEPNATIQWMRDGSVIEIDAGKENGKYSEKKERGCRSLIIRELEFEDQAEWKCSASNEYGHSMSCAGVKLIIPGGYKKPKFLESLRAVLSEEGTVNLECKVIGVPVPILKWYKDGVELKAGDIHRIISGADGTCCLGTYTCVAKNCMGEVSSSAALLGFEDKLEKEQQQQAEQQAQRQQQNLTRDPSLSTIMEERTSQMLSVYDTPPNVPKSIEEEDGARDISVSIDGKDVSVSLYETPDLTENDAKAIIEMFANEYSEYISEHNVIPLPSLRFVKETSTSGKIVMEAVLIDVTDDPFDTAKSASMGGVLREDPTEADYNDDEFSDSFESPMELSATSDVPEGGKGSRPGSFREKRKHSESISRKSSEKKRKGGAGSGGSIHSGDESSRGREVTPKELEMFGEQSGASVYLSAESDGVRRASVKSEIEAMSERLEALEEFERLMGEKILTGELLQGFEVGDPMQFSNVETLKEGAAPGAAEFGAHRVLEGEQFMGLAGQDSPILFENIESLGSHSLRETVIDDIDIIPGQGIEEFTAVPYSNVGEIFGEREQSLGNAEEVNVFGGERFIGIEMAEMVLEGADTFSEVDSLTIAAEKMESGSFGGAVESNVQEAQPGIVPPPRKKKAESKEKNGNVELKGMKVEEQVGDTRDIKEQEEQVELGEGKAKKKIVKESIEKGQIQELSGVKIQDSTKMEKTALTDSGKKDADEKHKLSRHEISVETAAMKTMEAPQKQTAEASGEAEIKNIAVVIAEETGHMQTENAMGKTSRKSSVKDENQLKEEGKTDLTKATVKKIEEKDPAKLKNGKVNEEQREEQDDNKTKRELAQFASKDVDNEEAKPTAVPRKAKMVKPEENVENVDTSGEQLGAMEKDGKVGKDQEGLQKVIKGVQKGEFETAEKVSEEDTDLTSKEPEKLQVNKDKDENGKAENEQKATKRDSRQTKGKTDKDTKENEAELKSEVEEKKDAALKKETEPNVKKEDAEKLKNKTIEIGSNVTTETENKENAGTTSKDSTIKAKEPDKKLKAEKERKEDADKDLTGTIDEDVTWRKDKKGKEDNASVYVDKETIETAGKEASSKSENQANDGAKIEAEGEIEKNTVESKPRLGTKEAAKDMDEKETKPNVGEANNLKDKNESTEKEPKERDAKLGKEKAEKEANEKDDKQKTEKQAKQKTDKEADNKADQGAKEKDAKENTENEDKQKDARLKPDKKENEGAAKDTKEKIEKIAKLKAEQEAKENSEKDHKDKPGDKTKEKADKGAKEKDAKLNEEKVAKDQDVKLKADKEAKDKAGKEAKEKADQEANEKDAELKTEKDTKQKTEKDAENKSEKEDKVKEAKLKAEKEAKEKAENEAKEKVDKTAKEKSEKEAKLKAEKEAKEKAEKEAKEKVDKEAKEKCEKEAMLKAEKEAKEKAEKEAKEKVDKEAKEKSEKEAKLKAEKEAEEKVDKEAKEKSEKEAKLKAEKEAKDKAEKEAKEKVDKEAKEKSEKEAKLKAETEARDKAKKEAKEKSENEAKEKEEKLKAEKEAKDKSEKEAKEKSEKEAKEKEAKLKAEKEAKEKAEKEAKDKTEKEAKEKSEKEGKEAKEKAEKEAKDKAEKEAKEKSEKEAKEKEAKLKAEKVAKEKAEKEAKEKADKEAKEKSEQEAKDAKLKAVREAKDKAEKEANEKSEREAKEKEAKLKAEKEAKEKNEKEDKDKAEKEPKEKDVKLKSEKEEKAEKEAKDKADKVAKLKAEKEEKEKAEKETKEKADKETKLKEEKEAKEKAEKEAKEKEAKLKEEKEAKEKADKEAKEKEAKLKEEKEAKEKADKEAKLKEEKEAKEKAEKEAKLKEEKEAKEKAEKEAKEKEAKLKAEKEAKEKADKEAKLKEEKEAREKAEKEAKEKDAKLKAEKEAKEKAEKEAKEKDAKLKAEKEAKEKAEKEAKGKAEKEAKEKAEKEAKEKASKLKSEKEAKEKTEKEAKEKAEKDAMEKVSKVAKGNGEEETTSKEAKLKVDQDSSDKKAAAAAEEEAKLKSEGTKPTKTRAESKDEKESPVDESKGPTESKRPSMEFKGVKKVNKIELQSLKLDGDGVTLQSGEQSGPGTPVDKKELGSPKSPKEKDSSSTRGSIDKKNGIEIGKVEDKSVKEAEISKRAEPTSPTRKSGVKDKSCSPDEESTSPKVKTGSVKDKPKDSKEAGNAKSRSGSTSEPGSAKSRSGSTSEPGSAKCRPGSTSEPGSAKSRSGSTSETGTAKSRSGSTSEPGGAKEEPAAQQIKPGSLKKDQVSSKKVEPEHPNEDVNESAKKKADDTAERKKSIVKKDSVKGGLEKESEVVDSKVVSTEKKKTSVKDKKGKDDVKAGKAVEKVATSNDNANAGEEAKSSSPEPESTHAPAKTPRKLSNDTAETSKEEGLKRKTSKSSPSSQEVTPEKKKVSQEEQVSEYETKSDKISTGDTSETTTRKKASSTVDRTDNSQKLEAIKVGIDTAESKLPEERSYSTQKVETKAVESRGYGAEKTYESTNSAAVQRTIDKPYHAPLYDRPPVSRRDVEAIRASPSACERSSRTPTRVLDSHPRTSAYTSTSPNYQYDYSYQRSTPVREDSPSTYRYSKRSHDLQPYRLTERAKSYDHLPGYFYGQDTFSGESRGVVTCGGGLGRSGRALTPGYSSSRVSSAQNLISRTHHDTSFHTGQSKPLRSMEDLTLMDQTHQFSRELRQQQVKAMQRKWKSGWNQNEEGSLSALAELPTSEIAGGPAPPPRLKRRNNYQVKLSSEAEDIYGTTGKGDTAGSGLYSIPSYFTTPSVGYSYFSMASLSAAASQAVSGSFLALDEAHRMKRPRFSMKLQNRTTPENTEVVKFACTVFGTPEPTIQWYKNGLPIFSDRQKYTITSNCGVATLDIHNSERNDTGEYTCFARNFYGKAASTAILQVVGMDESGATKGYVSGDGSCVSALSVDKCIPVCFTTGIIETNFPEVNELVLECQVKGSPRPDVMWMKNGQTMITYGQTTYGRFRADFASIFETGKCRLIIQRPRESDSGVYTCIGRNYDHSAVGRKLCWTDEVTKCVNVKGGGQTSPKAGLYSSILPSNSSSFEYQAPRFISELEPFKRVRVGEDIALTVEITGVPQPDVRWFHHKNTIYPIKSTQHTRIISEAPGVHTLYIPQTDPFDLGTYTVRVTNKYGMVESSCSVSELIIGINDSPTLSGIRAGRKPIELLNVPPCFVQEPREFVVLRYGDDLVVECEVEGWPQVSVNLYRGCRNVTLQPRAYKELTPSAPASSTNTRQHVKFTLSNISCTDFGMYTVEAKNIVGVAKAFVNVKLLEGGHLNTSTRSTRSMTPGMYSCGLSPASSVASSGGRPFSAASSYHLPGSLSKLDHSSYPFSPSTRHHHPLRSISSRSLFYHQHQHNHSSLTNFYRSSAGSTFSLKKLSCSSHLLAKDY